MPEAIVFHRPVSLREISAVIEDTDIGVVPKRSDSFGDEAFSTETLKFIILGVPIILAETTVDRYYFNDDVVTFFPSGDISVLADCMLKLIEDEDLRSRQVARAQAFVATYSWDTRKGEYLSLVDHLTNFARPAESLAA